ncbi:MAG: hypothetical protein EXS63_03490 [Candidatus Omnitrophica bacterium]|nr:hypothetical protein [Candidatus Omnitrophota bacterium]
MKASGYYLYVFLLLTGCASTESLLGTHKLVTPPEFQQKVLLHVSDEYHMHQAPLSGYDVGDLANFHAQHTLPVVVEDAFREIFGEVKTFEEGTPQIETERSDSPAIFEVKMIDAANDTAFRSADEYRGEVTLAVAMKSPREHIFWQKAFLGKGYVKVNNEFGTNLGPQDALTDAMHHAVEQMQDAIIASPEVRNQLKYYKVIDEARKKQEVKA